MSEFILGSIFDIPIQLSFWSIAYFVYCVIAVCADSTFPTWFILSFAILSQLTLQVTILIHEFGHGIMASYLGGTVERILLWPFGGICFISMPHGKTAYVKVMNDLKVVSAGPATHIVQAYFWAGLISAFYPNVPIAPLFNPFSYGIQLSGTTIRSLFLLVSVHAIKVNMLLLLFNAMFPMYPMDAAKILASILQLVFRFTAQTTAQCLVFCSGGFAVLFIGYFTFISVHSDGISLNSQLSVLLGCMCFGEVLNIRRLINDNRLHEHPLFSYADEGDPEVSRNLTSNV